jgi:transposase
LDVPAAQRSLGLSGPAAKLSWSADAFVVQAHALLIHGGLRKDLPAVTAWLSLPYSNGPTEGVNTTVKLLKRQMYGRAESPRRVRRLDLLRPGRLSITLHGQR